MEQKDFRRYNQLKHKAFSEKRPLSVVERSELNRLGRIYVKSLWNDKV